MCGRFVRSSSPETFAELFGAQGEINLAPSYNVAPSQSVLVARNGEGGHRELALLHWGLIPHWAKEPKTPYSTINARAETVAIKPTFRTAFRHRRCLTAVDGYFEWKRLGTTKQPYYIHLKGGQPFTFAGVQDHWQKEGADHRILCHHRNRGKRSDEGYPRSYAGYFGSENYSAWLDPEQKDPRPLLTLLTLLQPYAGHDLEAYPVSTRVNSLKNNTPDLITVAP